MSEKSRFLSHKLKQHRTKQNSTREVFTVYGDNKKALIGLFDNLVVRIIIKQVVA